MYYLNGRTVGSFEVDGVDSRDYPDFSDAFISYAEYIDDGGELIDSELEELQNQYPELAAELAFESLI